jgi:hypothetical protein
VRAVNKTIVALPESEKGDVVFENDKTGIYFTKKDVLKAFSNIKNGNWITYCERIYLDEIETSIRKASSNVNLFNDYYDNGLDHLSKFHGRILEELLLNYDFVIFNKPENRYEDKIFYSKWGDKYGCCDAGFYFQDKEMFIMTRVYSDIVIIEDCDSIPKK